MGYKKNRYTLYPPPTGGPTILDEVILGYEFGPGESVQWQETGKINLSENPGDPVVVVEAVKGNVDLIFDGIGVPPTWFSGYILFDQSDERYQSLAVIPDINQAYEIVLVVYSIASASGTWMSNAGTGTHPNARGVGSNSTFRMNAGTDLIASETQIITVGQNIIVEMLFDGVNSEIFIDGVSKAIGNAGTNIANRPVMGSSGATENNRKLALYYIDHNLGANRTAWTNLVKAKYGVT